VASIFPLYLEINLLIYEENGRGKVKNVKEIRYNQYKEGKSRTAKDNGKIRASLWNHYY